MERIKILLQKLNELAGRGDKNSAIDIDLMLDYTRVVYADLLEMRKKAGVKIPILQEPSLAEMTEALAAPKHENETAKIVFTHKTPTEKKDIRNSIGINDKFLFISDLFKNNKTAYELALDEINQFETYQQAYNKLRSEFDWDEEHATTELFYNLLNIFFSAR